MRFYSVLNIIFGGIYVLLIKQKISNFLKEEDGMGTLEVLLIVAVLVAIALLFRGKIIEWVNSLLDKSDSQIEQF